MGTRMAWAIAGLALATSSTSGEPKLSLSLDLPKVARRGASMTAVFSVSNRGNEGTYFKRPWKWATNGMRLEAVNEAGVRFGSSTVLYDISRASVCTHFKALGPDESYVFKAELGGASNEGLPSLVLPPGRYRVRWVYDVEHYDEDEACATGGWRVFRGQAASEETAIAIE